MSLFLCKLKTMSQRFYTIQLISHVDVSSKCNKYFNFKVKMFFAILVLIGFTETDRFNGAYSKEFFK